MLIYKTKIDMHLHLRRKLYSAFIHRSRNMQQMFMPPLGLRVMYHFQSHYKNSKMEYISVCSYVNFKLFIS